MIAQNTNYLPNAPVHLVSPNGRVRPFGIGASTDIARGTALDAAVAAAVSGDVVRFGSGTFDLGTNQLDLAHGVSLVGPGRKGATLTGTRSKVNGCVIVPGNDSLIQGFTIQTTGVGSDAIAIGSQQSSLVHDKAFLRVLIRDVRSLNEIDFFQIYVATGADAGLVYDFAIEDCSALGAFDHVSTTLETTAPTVTGVIRNCHFVMDGTYSQGSTIVRGINLGPAGGNGTANIKIYGGSLRSTGGAIQNTPVNVAHPGTTAELYGVNIYSAGTGAFDVAQTGGTATAYNCIGSGTNGALTTSGTVTISGKAADATKVANTTPGTTGLALLDDSTAAAARATIGLNTRSVQLLCVPAGTALTTGDGKGGVFFRVPAAINGWNLTGAAATVTVVSSSGTPTIQVRRVRAGTPADMLSTRITIDQSELDSKDAAAAAVINTSNDDVATGDQIYIDCDVAGTSTEGLSVHLTFTEV